METLALFFTAVSAVAAAIAAWFMYRQTSMAIKEGQSAERLRNDLQVRENALLAVNNKILINQMWNDFNKIVIEGDEGLRSIVGDKNYRDLEPALVRRIYLMFCTINVVEVAWRLTQAGAMPKEQGEAILNDQAALLRNDEEAARYALTGRGYSQDFLDAIWSKVFEGESPPSAGPGQTVVQ